MAKMPCMRKGNERAIRGTSCDQMASLRGFWAEMVGAVTLLKWRRSSNSSICRFEQSAELDVGT